MKVERSGRALPISMGLVLLLMLTVVVGVFTTAQADNGEGSATLEVTLDTTKRSVLEADRITFISVVKNEGNESTGPLVAHLNVASLQRGIYVDPEDWSPRRTQFIDNIKPGASVRLEWIVQALAEGDFAVYVAVLPKDLSEPPVASPNLKLVVGSRTILDLMDALPVSIAVPLVLVVLLVVVRKRHQHRFQDPGPDATD